MRCTNVVKNIKYCNFKHHLSIKDSVYSTITIRDVVAEIYTRISYLFYFDNDVVSFNMKKKRNVPQTNHTKNIPNQHNASIYHRVL